MAGLYTYKMFENPKYRSGFNLTSKFAKTHSDVSSIRFLDSANGKVRMESEIARERSNKNDRIGNNVLFLRTVLFSFLPYY